MSNVAGAGWNPRAGWDEAGAPPSAGPPAATPMMTGGFAGAMPGGYPMAPPMAMAGGIMPPPMPMAGFGGAYNYPVAGYPMMQQGFNGMPGPPHGQGPVYTQPVNGYQHPVPFFPNDPRAPQPHPVVSQECAALNLQNSTGGMGCEPGYNYYFPQEHTKIHVIKSRDPPWQIPQGMSLNYSCYHVPVLTTLADLMKGFGAINPLPRYNKVVEICPGSNGRWYKGMMFKADNKPAMKQTIKEFGWDSTRTGRPGEKPVVWLWITCDS